MQGNVCLSEETFSKSSNSRVIFGSSQNLDMHSNVLHILLVDLVGHCLDAAVFGFIHL